MNKKLLRKKLALMLANLKKKRPYYVECEYLESTGTQYIDTGIAPSNITPIVKMKFIPTQQYSLGNYGIFGCFGANNTRFQVFYNSIGIGTYVSKSWQSNTTYEVELNGKIPSATINGRVETSGYSNANGFSSYNMYLFTRNNGNVADNGVPLKLYYCKIWNNEILVRDLIPVLDWDMKPCMYDRVSEQLFYNAGTGNFIAGREIHPVEYLESTGTQYIDTGLLSTASSTVDTEFSFTSMESGAANNVGVFGGRNGTTTNTFTFFKIASATPQYFRFDYNGQSQVATASDMTWNTSSKYRFQYNGTNCITTNTTTGESVVLTRSPGSTFTQYPIYLFAVNTAGAIGQRLSGRIYYYKYSDGTKSVDMVPAISEDGTAFMFDRVSHTCFLNAGQGQFKYPAREVEYLKSDGESFLDTQYVVQPEDILTFGSNSIYGGGGSIDGAISSTTKRLHGFNTTANIYVGNTSYTVGSGLWDVNSIWKVDLKNGILHYGSHSVEMTGNYTSLPNVSFCFMARHNNMSGDTYDNYKKGSIFKFFKVTNNGTLVRDYIPAFKDGVAGMLDKQNNVFYGNAGTGSFSVGRILEPEYE